MTNTLFTNDNLFILHGLDSAIADLIYLDPPFNSKRMYSAPVGSKAAGAAFKDMWTWEDVNTAYLDTLVSKHPVLAKFILSVQEVHSKTMAAYLAYMAQRLIECHRVLKPTGCLYLHCDPTASHYLKGLLDVIFGRDACRNEITWKRQSAHSDAKKRFANVADIILYYVKSDAALFSPIYAKHDVDYVRKFYRHDDGDGRGMYRLDNMASPNPRPNMMYEWKGYDCPPKGWRYERSTMEQLDREGRIYYPQFTDKTNDTSKRLALKRYLNEQEGSIVTNIWTDINPLTSAAKESTGYPTQKPLALLQRIITASSKEGDLVLDPFCGCATTCVAAQQLHRRWIGIDIEKQASKILVERLADDAGMFSDFVHRTDVPKRTDIVEVQITMSVKEKLFKEQRGICNGCAIEFAIQNFEIDHIIPRAKGGGNYYENYQLLCGSCNRIKGDRPMVYLMNRLNVIEAAHKKISFGE